MLKEGHNLLSQPALHTRAHARANSKGGRKRLFLMAHTRSPSLPRRTHTHTPFLSLSLSFNCVEREALKSNWPGSLSLCLFRRLGERETEQGIKIPPFFLTHNTNCYSFFYNTLFLQTAIARAWQPDDCPSSSLVHGQSLSSLLCISLC